MRSTARDRQRSKAVPAGQLGCRLCVSYRFDVTAAPQQNLGARDRKHGRLQTSVVGEIAPMIDSRQTSGFKELVERIIEE